MLKVHWLNLFAKFSVTERTAVLDRHQWCSLYKQSLVPLLLFCFCFSIANSNHCQRFSFGDPA